MVPNLSFVVEVKFLCMGRVSRRLNLMIFGCVSDFLKVFLIIVLFSMMMVIMVKIDLQIVTKYSCEVHPSWSFLVLRHCRVDRAC